jgi:hypothetical protein
MLRTRATLRGPAHTAVVLAGVIGLVLPVALAFALRSRNTTAPASVPAPPRAQVATAEARFPAPPANAVVFARPSGKNLLALALVARPGAVFAQVSVVGPQGNGVAGIKTRVGTGRTLVRARACGPGCYSATLRIRGHTHFIRAQAGATQWLVKLPNKWPAPADTLVARAGHVWRSLQSMGYKDTLATGPGQVVVSTWRVQAPDRLAYRIRGGESAVIIGDRRWDRRAAHTWIESTQLRIRQPHPFWAAERDGHLIGTVKLRGLRAWRITFFDPTTRAWFTIVVDPRTLHTLELGMDASAHFMHDTYGAFDATEPIRPPHSRRNR